MSLEQPLFTVWTALLSLGAWGFRSELNRLGDSSADILKLTNALSCNNLHEEQWKRCLSRPSLRPTQSFQRSKANEYRTSHHVVFPSVWISLHKAKIAPNPDLITVTVVYSLLALYKGWRGGGGKPVGPTSHLNRLLLDLRCGYGNVATHSLVFGHRKKDGLVSGVRSVLTSLVFDVSSKFSLNSYVSILFFSIENGKITSSTVVLELHIYLSWFFKKYSWQKE